MKKITKYLMMACFYMLLSLVACVTNPEDVVPDDDDDPSPIHNKIDANKVTSSIKFKNSSTISGDIPIPTSTIDLKIDADTIFWVKGIKKRIRIKKPIDIAFGSLLVQVVGSDSHIETTFEENEESDSIAVFYFDFNPDEWELPISFELNILPKDEGGTPIDTSKKTVVIEPENDGSCSFQAGQSIWEWISTINNGKLHTAPMYPHITSGTVAGCCDSDGNSYYANCTGNSSHSVVAYESVFMVNLEFLKFQEGGDVSGELIQYTQNIRTSETDFCGKNPGYTKANVHNVYIGIYTYEASNCTISIASLEGETEPVLAPDGTKLGEINLPIYAGSGPIVQYKILSEHFMIESRNSEGPALERLYERRTAGFKWYD